MMMDFMTLAAGVMVGSLAAFVVMTVLFVALSCNKKVMKAYMKWVMKMTGEITDEMFNEDAEEL